MSLELVSKETVVKQEEQTTRYTLKNGIPVTIRNLPESDLMTLVTIFKFGYKDNPLTNRILGRLTLAVITQSSQKYSRDEMRKIREKYALRISCSERVEYTTCSMGGLADFWEHGIGLLNDLLTNPDFNEEVFKLEKDKLKASLEGTPTDPSDYVNDIVNQIFYDNTHPFASDYKEALKQLESTSIDDIKQFYKTHFGADTAEFVYVGNMNAKQVLPDLDKFNFKNRSHFQAVSVKEPVFDLNKSFNFEHRDIPSAYIRMKFNAPAVNADDMMATNLMLNILSDKLTEEIRTNLSLSYSVFASAVNLKLGIGFMGATTSKPQETLEAMSRIIKQIKSVRLSQDEVDEYKFGYATDYFLGLESHNSLAASLAWSIFNSGNTDLAYRFPQMLQDVSAESVQYVANKYLNNFRVGVIYHKDKFKKVWAEKFVKDHIR